MTDAFHSTIDVRAITPRQFKSEFHGQCTWDHLCCGSCGG